MYTKDNFSLADIADLRAFVDTRSFGVLATHTANRVYTSPIPFDLREDETGALFVAGHIARANEMLESFVPGTPATITITGADIFVPAEWFGVRHRIPTWLYESVEISGTLVPVDFETMVADVNTMIARLQKQSVPNSTWTLDEIDVSLSSQYLKWIAGYRMHDLQIKSCYRLNQGKDHCPALIDHLRANGTSESRHLADLVETPPTLKPS